MERIQKYLARCGISSRRDSEKLLIDGLIKINGKTVKEPGFKISPNTDIVEISGEILKPPDLQYYILNKPAGFITSVSDPFCKKTVMDLVKLIPYRIFPVGRLDMDTEGLLLLTNDGELCNILTHPKFQIEKEYFIVINGILSREHLNKLTNGILLEDGKTKPSIVTILKQGPNFTHISLIIKEGKKRQIRRMFKALGFKVLYLKRTTLGPIKIGNLKTGNYRKLTPNEIKLLNEMKLKLNLKKVEKELKKY